MPGTADVLVRSIRRALDKGDLDARSDVRDVPGIGPYLEGRIRKSLRLRGTSKVTIGAVWNAMKRRSTDEVKEWLYLTLQNERGNQCVSDRIAAREHKSRYHTGDINEFGYAAMATLLNHARDNPRVVRGGGVRYGALPRTLGARGRPSRTCGCRSLRTCTRDRLCTRSDDGRACVPRAANSPGFLGVPPHPNQAERLQDAVRDTVRVRRASRTRDSALLRRDPDSVSDRQAGRAMILQYSPRGTWLWRRPGSKVRVPRTTL